MARHEREGGTPPRPPSACHRTHSSVAVAEHLRSVQLRSPSSSLHMLRCDGPCHPKKTRLEATTPTGPPEPYLRPCPSPVGTVNLTAVAARAFDGGTRRVAVERKTDHGVNSTPLRWARKSPKPPPRRPQRVPERCHRAGAFDLSRTGASRRSPSGPLSSSIQHDSLDGPLGFGTEGGRQRCLARFPAPTQPARLPAPRAPPRDSQSGRPGCPAQSPAPATSWRHPLSVTLAVGGDRDDWRGAEYSHPREPSPCSPLPRSRRPSVCHSAVGGNNPVQ